MRACWIVLLLLVAGCGDDPLTRLTGTLEVTAINATADAARVTATVLRATDDANGDAPVDRPATVILLEALDPGTWDVRVDARDEDGVPLQAVWVDGVQIPARVVTELLVDLSESPVPPPAEVCDGVDNDGDGIIDEPEDLALCGECLGGREIALADDDRCLPAACDDLDGHQLRGTNAFDAESTCVALSHGASGRCDGIGRCVPATCTPVEAIVATAGLCRSIVEANCVAGVPTIEVAPDGAPCAADRVCRSGDCVPVDPPQPDVGCADGAREGFLDQTTHPSIAGCSGGWSLPGVTIDLTPGCGRSSGDDSANPSGLGCTALDLCADGWHLCDGKSAVAARSADGCASAVPAGTPDKSLFFAVRQSSLQGSACTDDGSGDNDVFGCGNLGNALPADKNCGPLDRVLASTAPNRCGFNEAEPPLGPWECLGPDDSHFHEGALVTKKACASGDCTYDGAPIGTWDKGGVLCCR